ncbi:DUF2586 domain-containing protein [Methylobacter sp. S3L5C]|uniref:DUF2586 domain-containing protein n=1 Tax=Methylobacter sp. S3L5C TaxID=2839024 RepID=UPI001FABE772|nr:DUF2586 domain-containing protein [Methylobacter sp. S3L5C]UOA08605.1 DUF2586 domain-containing protein [Methylobacter sp. S3L5C]
MALGKITVNALNLNQGPFPTVEKYFLFIGMGLTGTDTLLFLNTDSDLDIELGIADSELKTQVKAAKANAGQNWACCAVPVTDGALWESAFDMAMNNNVKIEAVVICTPVLVQADLTAMHTKAEETNATYGRRLFFIAGAIAIDSTPTTGQNWSAYITALTALTVTLAAMRVSVVPYIYPDAVGIYAGRLCNYQTSVADTPMRVNTGSLVGQDQSTLPVDSAGIIYNNAHAKALNDQRFSVPQFYPDYEGVYWSDGSLLDTATGDYTVIENLRVIDKAARAVRLVLIGLVGDRRFNSSPIGTAWAMSKLMRPLFEMSRSTDFQGIPFPAELKSPVDGDIAITWITRTSVNIFIIARPLDIPKDLTANIVLDLSTIA